MSPRRNLPRWVFVPALLGLALVIGPLLALLPKVHWATFVSDITEPTTAAALWLSVRSAAIAVVACVVLGVPLALVIARAPRRLAVVLRTIVTLPLVLPPLVGGVALLAVLGRTGILGPWLENLGVSVPFTPAAVVVAQTFVAMPFLVISVESALSTVGTDYEEVAAGLGASRTRILTRVTLPLILPGLLAGIVLAFARSVGEFGATALLAGNRPGQTQTIPMAIYTAFNGVGTSRQAAMALSVLLVAAALVVLLFFPAARGSSHAVAQKNARVAPDEPRPSETTAPTPTDRIDRGKDLAVACEFRWPGFQFAANLEVGAGEVLAVVGPNAAGKTTLLNLIAGNLTPHAGQIRLGGEIVSTPATVVPPRHRHVGVLSQQPRLFPHLNVIDNVAFGPRSRGVPRAVARARARDLLAHVGAGGTEQKKPAALSGGQQQRVALARALATDPAVLLLDEPLAAMDVSVSPAIRAVIAREIARTRMTTILVTHSLLDVVSLAGRVAVIEGGRLVENAPAETFLTAPTSAFGAALTGVNALPDHEGNVLHLRDEDLRLDTHAPRDGSRAWQGVVDHVDVVGGTSRVRVTVAGRPVTVAADIDAATRFHPGTTVWLTRREA